jgi:MFS family permease
MADKIGRAKIMGLGDMWLSVLIMIIAVSFIIQQPSVWLLVVVGLAAGVLNGLWYPAFAGMIPIIVPEEKRQSANAAIGFGSNLAFMLGTVSGGVVVSQLGVGYALGIDALSFLIAGAMVYPLHKLPQPGRSEVGDDSKFAHELKLGWREFRTRSWLVAVVIGFAFINATIEAVWAVLGALQSQQKYDGASSWSLILGCMSIGFLLGTIIANQLKPKRPLVVLMVLMLADPIFLLVFGTAQPIWAVLISAVFMGIAMDVFYVIWSTVVQQQIPEEVLSRVNSYDTFGSFLFGPLGMLIAGPLAITFGTQVTMLGASLMAVVAIVGVLAVPSVRRLALRTN